MASLRKACHAHVCVKRSNLVSVHLFCCECFFKICKVKNSYRKTPLRIYSEYFYSSPSAFYHNLLFAGFTYKKRQEIVDSRTRNPWKLFMIRASCRNVIDFLSLKVFPVGYQPHLILFVADTYFCVMGSRKTSSGLARRCKPIAIGQYVANCGLIPRT